MAARKKKASRKPARKTVKARGKSGAKAAKRKAPKRKAPKRKAAARKPARKKAPARKKKQIMGEGDYEASRAFLKDQAGFVKKNKARIPKLGRQAEAAMQGVEGDALRAAEAEARNRSRAPGEDLAEAMDPGVLVIPPG